MAQIRRMFKYLIRFLKDGKYRNRILNMMSQTTETTKKSQIIDSNLLSALEGRKLFFIGGCELSFLKEYLENNLNIQALHTFDYGASSNPMIEVKDKESELWSFNPDVVVLSHNQQIRSYFQAVQLKSVQYKEQEKQLKEIKTTFNLTIETLRKNGIKGPIFIYTYPLVYRPALGQFEYHSINTGYSLIELINKINLTFYDVAKGNSDVFILNNDEIFIGIGKNQYIRNIDADGIYEHVTRAGATILGDELISILQIHYNLVKKIKCIVVDLDNTLWDGIIQDDGITGVNLYFNRINVLKMLQRRGLMLAIASKNEPGAKPLIKELLGEHFDLFIVKKINWNNKVQSIQEIARELNVGIDSIAFFDDNPYERDLVKQLLPEVSVYRETEILDILKRTEFDPGVITQESTKRVEMVKVQKKRENDEKIFQGSIEKFLKSIHMKLWIREASKKDLSRVTELIQRTNQLNTTTIRYKKEEIIEFHESSNHKIFVVNLWDAYGEYGLIGIAIVEEKRSKEWNIISFLFSCRAMGKTVEVNTIAHIQQIAKQNNIQKLIGQYRKSDRNTAIKKVFQESQFEKEENEGEYEIWVFDLNKKSPLSYLEWMEVVKKPPN